MLAGACAAIAVFLTVRSPARARCTRIFPRTAAPKRPGLSPAALGTALALPACLAVFGLRTGLLAALVAMPVLWHTIARLESGASRRRRLKIARQLPGAVDLLIAVLDAGRSPTEAFALVGRASAEPLGSEFGVIASRLTVTGDQAALWRALRARPEFATLGRAFGRAERSGMPIARVLERLAEDLRREQRASTAQRARSVAVSTAAPLGLCFLPAFFLIGIVPTLIGAFSDLGW